MGKKIFVTYKYSDANVLRLNGLYTTTVRNYVDELQNLLDQEDHINKGENDGEDLSNFKDSTIESKLRDKIYDSSITIIMVSQGMRESYKKELDQWIPWEVSYSLKEHSRDGRTSKSNALLAVVIPDSIGRYDYFFSECTCPSNYCTIYDRSKLFKILKDNMFNIKKPVTENCNNKGINLYYGNFSYIYSVKWYDFKSDINKFIDIAVSINDNIENYNIMKLVD